MNVGSAGTLAGAASVAAVVYKRNAPSQAYSGAIVKETAGNVPVDTVELSMQLELEQKRDERLFGTKKEAGFTGEDVAAVKERFRSMTSLQKSILSRLRELAEKKGIALEPLDQVKVEIDSGGKIIVGGIKDAKTAKKLERALNQAPDLAKDILKFQEMEKSVSQELREITGMSLGDFRKRIALLQSGSDLEELPFGPDGTVYTRKELLQLKEQDLYAADSEFAGMISEYFAVPDLGFDITGENDILEKADETVNRIVQQIITKVSLQFKLINDDTRQRAGIDFPIEELPERLLSLRNLIIRADSEGGLEIEGTAAKNRDMDKIGKEVVKELFERNLKKFAENGKKNDFNIAAEYLLNRYDHVFGEDDPNRRLQVTFEKFVIEAHIVSPEKEAELREEIDEEARAALEEMDIVTEGVVLEVGDDGKITAVNIDPEENRQLFMALELLNARIENRTPEDYLTTRSALTPTERLKGLMARLDVFLPRGAGKLAGAALNTPEELAKDIV